MLSWPTKLLTKSSAGCASRVSGWSSCNSLPARKMAILSPSLIASSMSWLTMITVLFKARCISKNSFWIISRLIGSTAPNGSSISSTGASAAKARITPIRCCWPPDSSRG
ncbi:hypothetical protein D3C75_940700 [compost metagenome]